MGNQSGQASVEYLIVGLALMAVIATLGLLGGKVGEGLFVEHAADSASHATTVNTAGVVGDVLLY
ncbi:MAG: hypothetical protein LBU31_04520 [Coriobacteriales bacterium]|jgi:Flp pilus assembly pilin Flp|nr:hypothetical protein [Coriobacteriales bacterium]